ncbi:MAG TPA: hypothetical protein VIJ95_15525 [Hanamia sp.]
MKKLKLNLQHLENAEVLTRSQLKNVLGGSAVSTTGNCQTDGQACSTRSQVNCCSGLQCTDYKCGYPTV